MQNYSPINRLFDLVAASPFRIAPEGAESLYREVDVQQIPLEYVEDDTTGVRQKVFAEFDTEKRVVRLGDGFLEALWAATHLYLLAFRGYQQAQAANVETFELGKDPQVRDAYRLYLNRLDSLIGHRSTPWPDKTVKPIRYPYKHSDGFATNELFLVATGWIIHHELAHGRLNHREDAPNSIELEHEADTEATLKSCESPANEKELIKRTLGISAAVLLLIAMEIKENRQVFTTHPPSYERLLNVLSVAKLDATHITYAVVFVILDLHLTSANLTTQLNRDHDNFFDLCFEACQILRNR